MLNRDDHDAFVALLYASALGDTPWLGTLERLANRFGASKALLQSMDASGQMVGFEVHGYSVDFSARFYVDEIYRNDPRLPYFHTVKPGHLYFDHGLFDADEMGRDPRVRACCDALGVTYQLGAVSALPDGNTTWLTLLSTEAQGHASREAIDAYRRLAPHMAQALSLGQVLGARAATQTALLEAMARKADGIIILGSTGAPTFMNAEAEAMLAAGDGLAFAAGQFVTCRGAETRRLRRLIADVIAAAPPCEARPGGEMLVTRSNGKRPYVLRAMPAPRTERFLTGVSIAAMIHLHDLAALHVPSRPLLTAAFGLTAREADLAVELVRCANLAGAAANAGMAPNTARNHLQGIFRKSGTSSQAEAVQLFSRLA